MSNYLFSGNPVWPGTELTVNTCDNLDWLRAFGTHLWYLTSPAASISDALNLYEEAFQKETTQFGAYAKAPCPTYIVENTTNDSSAEDIFDIRFHLLKLYGNKAHKIESIVVPKTYTNQPLDNKLGWLVSKCFNYRTRAIISRVLFIFYPIFEDHFFVFKEVFQKILSLCMVSI